MIPTDYILQKLYPQDKSEIQVETHPLNSLLQVPVKYSNKNTCHLCLQWRNLHISTFTDMSQHKAEY